MINLCSMKSFQNPNNFCKSSKFKNKVKINQSQYGKQFFAANQINFIFSDITVQYLKVNTFRARKIGLVYV